MFGLPELFTHVTTNVFTSISESKDKLPKFHHITATLVDRLYSKIIHKLVYAFEHLCAKSDEKIPVMSGQKVSFFVFFVCLFFCRFLIYPFGL